MALARFLSFVMAALAALPAWAEGAAHADPSAPVAAALALILLAAKVGGEAAVRLGQPSVLGELITGIILGNLQLFGLPGLDHIAHDPSIDMFARLGVLVLLFEVGLESTVRQMWSVGRPSLLVAVVGVIAPLGLGWLVALTMLPNASPYTQGFLGAALTATSVGVSARVLKDLGQSRSAESRIILGAAVIDDVLGLIVLAVATGLVGHNGSFSLSSVAGIAGRAIGFLAVSILIGVLVTPRLFKAGASLRVGGVLLAMGLSFCFLMSWLADLVGLAPLVGAFAAGLILEDAHSRTFVQRGELDLGGLLHPISDFLVPVFFVVTGMRTDLSAFTRPSVMLLGLILSLVAVLGKVLSGVVVRGGLNRLVVGVGMVPRGEVGLIFANVGLSLSIAGRPLLNQDTFAAIVIMVLVTTMMTPPLLKWAMGRSANARA